MDTHIRGHLFSRSYEAILPSSLTRVISRTLVFSTCLPVSVYGTGAVLLARRFSRQRGINQFVPVGTPTRFSDITGWICLPQSSYGLRPTLPIVGWFSLLRPSIAHNANGGSGISTCSPSPTSLDLGLGPTNPGRTNLPQETLDLRAIGFSPMFSLLMPTFSLVLRPHLLTLMLRPIVQRSPTD